MSFSQPAPAVEVIDPAKDTATDKAQTEPADLSAPTSVLGTSSPLASTSLFAPPLKQEGRGAVSVAEQASADHAADGDRIPARDGQVSPSLALEEPPSPAFNQTEQPGARREEPSAAAATRAASVNPPDGQARSLLPSAAVAPSRISTEPAAQVESLVSEVAPVQESSSTSHSGQGGTSMPSVKSVETSISESIAIEAPGRMAEAASTPAALSSQPAAVPAEVAKSRSGGSGESSPADGVRPAREIGKTESSQRGSRLVEGQPSSATVDALVIARDGTGVHGAMGAAGGFAGAATAEAAGPDPRETFAAIDAGSTGGKPTWIHAGMQRAEAGFQDPALGWVGVRADTSGGGVHAQLVPGSADAAQALSGHLAGLNAHLAAHHTPVETVTLTAPESGWSWQGRRPESGTKHAAGGRAAGRRPDSPGRSCQRPIQRVRQHSGSTGGFRSSGNSEGVGSEQRGGEGVWRPHFGDGLSLSTGSVAISPESDPRANKSPAKPCAGGEKKLKRNKEEMMAAAAGILNHPETAAQAFTAKTATPMAAAANSTGSSSDTAATITANDFLTLLVTEMKNQDPTATTDPNEYINQLVNVNSLQQLVSINQTVTSAFSSSSSSTSKSSTDSSGTAKSLTVQSTSTHAEAASSGGATSLPASLSAAAAKLAPGNLGVPAANSAANSLALVPERAASGEVALPGLD